VTYLCLTAKSREEHRPALQWWQAFIADPEAALSTPPAPERAQPKRKRRRRRRRRPVPGAESPAF